MLIKNTSVYTMLPPALTEAVSAFLDTVSPDATSFRASIRTIVSLLTSQQCVLLDMIEAAGPQLVDENSLVRSKALALIRLVLEEAAAQQTPFQEKEGASFYSSVSIARLAHVCLQCKCCGPFWSVAGKTIRVEMRRCSQCTILSRLTTTW